MRTFILLLIIFSAGFYLVKNHERVLGKFRPPESARDTRPTPPKREEISHGEALTAADYAGFGLPSLDVGWDATALKKLTFALQLLASAKPHALPTADTDYGKAFFRKLSYTVDRFPLLSSDHKVKTYNAFLPLLPIYAKAHNKGGPRRDLELALLIGLEFKLIVSYTEDHLFVKDLTDVKTRSHVDLDHNLIVARPASIFFRETRESISKSIKESLDMLADAAVFRPEARMLALSHISRHLPAIALRLDLKNMREVLTRLRARETHAQARAY